MSVKALLAAKRVGLLKKHQKQKILKLPVKYNIIINQGGFFNVLPPYWMLKGRNSIFIMLHTEGK